MNSKDKKKEIFEATRNVIPGEYDTIDLFYKWHVNKQIELLKDMKHEMCLAVYNSIDDKIKELKGDK